MIAPCEDTRCPCETGELCSFTGDQYRSGQSLGYEYADADRHEWASFATGEAELRAEAVEARADSPSWRAFKLGIVRAYRDATRTLRNGRWGT